MGPRLYTEEEIERLDRCARAYGWEVGRGHPIVEELETTEENPFMDPDWKKTHGL